MGGGVWRDNFDGTYTQLDDDYDLPAAGWPYLDPYLMGLISPAEVSDFFIVRNLVPAGKDANGHAVFKADRTKVTIQEVITETARGCPASTNRSGSSTPEWRLSSGTAKNQARASGRDSQTVDGLFFDHHRTPRAPRVHDRKPALNHIHALGP